MNLFQELRKNLIHTLNKIDQYDKSIIKRICQNLI